MKCQILFSGKNKKNIINLPSAENAQRVVKVNLQWLELPMSRKNCHGPKDVLAIEIGLYTGNFSIITLYIQDKKYM